MEILEVFEYYDEPLLFTCRDGTDNLYLGLSVDTGVWLYVELQSGELELLKNRKMDLHTCFSYKDRWFYAIQTCYDLWFYASAIRPVDDQLPERGEYL